MAPSRIFKSDSPILTNSVGESEVFTGAAAGWMGRSRIGLVILEPRDCLGFRKRELDEVDDLLVVEVAQVDVMNFLPLLLLV